MKKVIYYFTGTGNSMRAAEKIARRLGDTEIISMRSLPAEVPATDCDVIGLIYPVYHWTLPEPVVRFVEGLSLPPNAYIFTVAMPSLVVGFACERLAELLSAKGAELSYGAKVHSVANYAIVYSPMPPPKLVVPKTERRLERIAEEVAGNVRKPYPRASALIRKQYPKVMPEYKAIQQYADYPFTISADCISCGLCAKVCPCYNIKMEEGRPLFLHHCAQCMACVCYCPKRAIGYHLRQEQLDLLGGITSHVPVVKRMGLPPKRKLYHNPYISAADIIKNRVKID